MTLDKKAVELTLRPGSPPALLLQGKRRPLQLPPLEAFEIDLYLKAIQPEGRPESAEFEIPLEKQGRFLVRVDRDVKGRALTFRPLT